MPTRTRADTRLLVGVGDIHGRFRRLVDWVQEVSRERGKPIAQALAVGDVEAFRLADDHRRKAAKRTMPAEFALIADGQEQLPFPLSFIGGNNEDFETLAPLAKGGALAPNVTYLGRSGVREVAGLRVAFLSGIHAPRFLDQPLIPPRDAATRKQAGYFRRVEVERLRRARDVDLLLLHEWPRGLGGQHVEGIAGPSPWMGSPLARSVVEHLRPAWVLCGHSHRAWAAELHWPDGGSTKVACLDQLSRPETSLLWMEAEGREIVRVGWGPGGGTIWEEGRPWGPSVLPRLEVGAGMEAS